MGWGGMTRQNKSKTLTDTENSTTTKKLMPNWCDNKLEISGPEADIERFLTPLEPKECDDGKIHLTRSFLETYLPEPKEWEAEIPTLLEYARKDCPSVTEADIRANPWYHWRLKNWSTKWIDSDGDRGAMLRRDEHGIILIFESAWNPPVDGIVSISRGFPTLTLFDQFTIEVDWAGQFKVKAGEVLQDEWHQMDVNPPRRRATHTAVEAPVVQECLNPLLM
jgi:hypothetical protein